MEPVSVAALSAVLTGLLKRPSEEAGGRAITALKRLLRRSGSGSEDEADVAELPAKIEEGDVPALAARLVAAAEHDPPLSRELQVWLQDARAVVGDDSVTNTNTGSVEGPLVQGRDFSGPISF